VSTSTYSNWLPPRAATRTVQSRDPMCRELQIQLIIRALQSPPSALATEDSVREQAMRLLYELEEAAR